MSWNELEEGDCAGVVEKIWVLGNGEAGSCLSEELFVPGKQFFRRANARTGRSQGPSASLKPSARIYADERPLNN